MARKIINTTHSMCYHDNISKTPGNYSKDNYFLRELQDKINAEWEYRPNRVGIKFENQWGEQTYSPIEVVMQTAKSEKGESLADDYKRIVFKDISENRFKIGSRFLIKTDFRGSVDDENVWIATNKNSAKMTSSMIIERCDGTLGSVVTDAQGISHYHYEPVAQNKNLSGVNLSYNDIAVLQKGQIVLMAQYNDYTRAYFVNQRFIIGEDQVYRVQAINKSMSRSTFKAGDVGLVYIYLEITEKSPQDDFERRIASQTTGTVAITPSKNGNYKICFSEPETLPTYITSEGVTLRPIVKNDAGEVIDDVPVSLTMNIKSLPKNMKMEDIITVDEVDGAVSIKRKRVWLAGDLDILWYVPVNPEIGIQKKIELSMHLRLDR